MTGRVRSCCICCGIYIEYCVVMEYLGNPLVQKALDFARLSLAGKKRNSGEDVVEHCLRSAENLIKYKITDPSALAVAVLHHSIHEGAATVDDIRNEFGDDIAGMMEAFEKLRVIQPRAKMGETFA